MAKNKSKLKFIEEFKAFINRGSIIDLAVGVIIGGAFSAIVTSVVNILLSICTWALPGGITGLVTVLPAANSAQSGIVGIGQSFAAGDLTTMTEVYAKAKGIENLQPSDDTYLQWQNALCGEYSLKGGNYYYKGSAIIDWGALLNAAISFLIIALVLFLVVKAVAKAKSARQKLVDEAQETYYRLHPSERPAPTTPGVPAPTQMDVLVQIRDELRKQNGKPTAKK